MFSPDFLFEQNQEGELVRDEIHNLLRQIPPMDELLSRPWVSEIEPLLGREAMKSVFADVIGELRMDLREGKSVDIDVRRIEEEARKRLQLKAAVSLCPVINATGIVIHTNLGRSVLPREALEAVVATGGRYSNLEYRLDEGGRGQRNDHVEWLLCQITGADAALVVNNNAAAVLLCLSALARDREAVVSRGELVEIGGSFRIPDVMAFAGTKMIEVGTTNRTHLADYVGAVTAETAMLLKVHPSNYRIVGFHAEASREELAALAREKDLILLEDLGSGVVADLAPSGLEGEPTVRQCLLAGVDVVTFSGDKLLGGPQIGVVAGRKQIVERLRRFPLLRALRVDKMTLAALESVLRLYLQGKSGVIPTVHMLRLSGEELRSRAQALACRLVEAFPQGAFEAIPVEDAAGGGAFPEHPLPGWAVAMTFPGLSSSTLQRKLRKGAFPAVVGIWNDRVTAHVRTLLDGDEERLVQALNDLVGEGDEGLER